MVIKRFASLDSTQDHALRLLRDSPNGGSEEAVPDWTVIAADCQTRGRGRREARWHSPAGANLYFSVIFSPPESMNEPAVVNHAIALSVARVLHDRGLDCRIKWPNDILANGRKLCGILSTLTTDAGGKRRIVSGIGVNVNMAEFPPSLCGRATSMRAETGLDYDRESLLLELLASMKAGIGSLFRAGFAPEIPAYVATMAQLGEAYSSPDGSPLRGRIEGVDERGRLLVRSEAGLTAVGA